MISRIFLLSVDDIRVAYVYYADLRLEDEHCFP